MKCELFFDSVDETKLVDCTNVAVVAHIFWTMALITFPNTFHGKIHSLRFFSTK